jgi:hypothetical protein
MQVEELARRGGPDDFLPVLRRMTGNGDVHGYDADGDFCILEHESLEIAPAEGFVETLLAEIEALRADRERLRSQPVAARPPAEEQDDRRRHVLSLELGLQPDAVLTALRSLAREAATAFPGLEIQGRYDDTPWAIATDPLPESFLEKSEDIFVELVYARRGKIYDAFEIYLSPDRVYAPVPGLKGLTMLFRTVEPPAKDATAARGIELLRAALAREGVTIRAED